MQTVASLPGFLLTNLVTGRLLGQGLAAIAAAAFLCRKALTSQRLRIVRANLQAKFGSPANDDSERAQVEAIDRSQMMIELGMDGIVLKVNQNYTRCFGYTLDEVRGQPFSLVVTDEDLNSGAYQAFWAALRSGKYQTGQYERVKKNGQPIWIEASYNPILDARGVPLKVVGLLSDVSARVRMEQERERQEEALRRSERFLEETGSMAGVGGWEVDLSTGAVIWLPETYRLLGADLSYQPTLADALNLYTEESKPIITEAIERAKADGTSWDLELSLFRMDGRQIWARVVGRAKFADGKPVCLFGAFQDITSRIEERKALLWANERAELATTSGGIGIWDWNLEKNTLVCDAQMYRMVHKDPDRKQEADFRFWSKFVHPGDMPRVEQALKDAIEQGKPYAAEYRILLEDGQHFIRATGQVSYDHNGRPYRMVGTNVDVTAQIAAHQALEDANERIALATESGGIGIWEWNILTDRMIMDRRMLRLYDMMDHAAEPITYQTWVRHLHPADREAAEQQAHDSLQGRRSFDQEFRILCGDGSVRYARATGKVIRDASGRPTRMFGANLEITAHKQAEEALREQASLLDLCHGAIIVRSLDGAIRLWSRGAEEMYGYRKSQALGKISHELLATVSQVPLAEIERTVVEQGRWEGTLEHKTENGKHITVDSRWALARDKHGRAVGVLEINNDITERQRTEEALRQSAEKEQLLVNGVKDYAIIMLDTCGNVATWNEGAQQIKGYTSEEIIGRHMSVFYTPEDNAAGKSQKVLDVARREGRFEDVAWRVRKDGSHFWANVVITALFDNQQQLRGYGKVTRDITDTKLAQEATEQARIAADMANRAKSDFLANMSHEVRTPVNAIMGMAHLALRADPVPKQREYLVKIDTAARRLLSIMNDILDFSKIEAGKLKLERIEFALSEVMQTLRDIVEQKAREKGLALVFPSMRMYPFVFRGIRCALARC